jgi:hypothetical protein
MAEPLPSSLSRAREQKIIELSHHFANDDLSLEDLERRIERVYKAVTVAELETITADLQAAAPLVDVRGAVSPANPAIESRRMPTALPPAGYEIPHSRLLAIMSTMRRAGRWAVPRELRMLALMSDTKLDLTQAALPVGGVVNIEITAVMASVKLIVPPGMRVINETHSFMADVRNGADEYDTGALTSPKSPVVRLTGTAFMAEVKVKVRRREEPVYEEDE